MFTGLIEEVGSVASVAKGAGGLRIEILSPFPSGALEVGSSVCVDGVCLTVTALAPRRFTVEAVGDTLEKTTLKRLERGARVNLERALSASGRLDGHLVMGHVTGTAEILSFGPASGADPREAWFLVLGLHGAWSDRVVPEGSIAVDGISLTVAEIDAFSPGAKRMTARISVIPHTREKTALADKKAGDEVNVELDLIASYVRAAVRAAATSGVSREQLQSWGY